MMQRRHWLAVSAGAVAAAAGAGFSWWRLRGDPSAGVPPGFWTQRFEAPSGPAVTLADFQGRPLIVNFWATWCPPCVKEMPQIEQFYREHRSLGWQVLGLAIDGPTPVREFLKKVPVSFPIGLAGFGGTELVKALGNTAGGLPFTVAFNDRGELVQRKLGETSYEELSAWARPRA